MEVNEVVVVNVVAVEREEVVVEIVQHKAYFLIQLNADSLYPFAC